MKQFETFVTHDMQRRVNVTTENAVAAEALVFKVDQKAPAGIVAKIEFAMKKAESNDLQVRVHPDCPLIRGDERAAAFRSAPHFQPTGEATAVM